MVNLWDWAAITKSSFRFLSQFPFPSQVLINHWAFFCLLSFSRNFIHIKLYSGLLCSFLFIQNQFCLLRSLFVLLKGGVVGGGERERPKRKKSSIHYFTSQMSEWSPPEVMRPELNLGLWWWGPSAWAIICCLPEWVSRELDQKQSRRHAGFPSWDLIHRATAPTFFQHNVFEVYLMLHNTSTFQEYSWPLSGRRTLCWWGKDPLRCATWW